MAKPLAVDAEAIREWIKERRAESKKSFHEAEEAREESQYTDIDALEQSVYNEAVLDTINDLGELLDKLRRKVRR